MVSDSHSARASPRLLRSASRAPIRVDCNVRMFIPAIPTRRACNLWYRESPMTGGAAAKERQQKLAVPAPE